jgi:hypothetical protein
MTERNETLASEADKPAARRDSRLFEVVIGAGVLLISLISLFVAVSANRTQERMLAASVWPSLMFGTSSVSPEGIPEIRLDLLNRGTGPARVRWAEVLYDGTPVHDSRSLLSHCCGQRPESSDDDQVFTSGIQNRVLGADEWITLLRMPRPNPSTPVWEALSGERHKIRLRACYCSVLDDCWLLDSDRDDPESVRQCPRKPAVLWGGE